jgi:hypothetical protein
MSKCSHCKKEVDVEWDTGFIWIGCDGDLVCSETCKQKYEKERDYFCEVVLNDDKLFASWLGVPIEMIAKK